MAFIERTAARENLGFRGNVLALLGAYEPSDANEARAKAEILRFIAENEVLGRGNAAGHLTGSAFVVNAARTRALLNHHAKLGQWMQFGGHVEAGDARIVATALREAAEESGLDRLTLASPSVFDLDAHVIPERAGVAAHRHYDVRFLLEADEGESFAVSEESKSLRWVGLDEIERYSGSESVLRMSRKVMRSRI
jgi:8-oxo-dGTP pyrophosphatase MutT (NUDIX family)